MLRNLLKEEIIKMTNPRLLQTAERWKNPEVPKLRTQNPVSVQNVSFPDLPTESFIFSYDGEHGQFFQELIAKNNELFNGTEAAIPIGTSGEIQGHLIKRLGLITTIYNNPQLKSANLYPITPMQSESLFKAGKLPNPSKYWEDLALLLYDTNGDNPKEAQALKESIVQHRTDLGLSQDDLEKKLVIVNAGGEPDQNMSYGVKPIVLSGLTQVYQHEVLDKTERDHKFEYGLDRGLPAVKDIGKGNRILYISMERNMGLRALFRNMVFGLDTRLKNFADMGSDDGRINFAPQRGPVRRKARR